MQKQDRLSKVYRFAGACLNSVVANLVTLCIVLGMSYLAAVGKWFSNRLLFPGVPMRVVVLILGALSAGLLIRKLLCPVSRELSRKNLRSIGKRLHHRKRHPAMSLAVSGLLQEQVDGLLGKSGEDLSLGEYLSILTWGFKSGCDLFFATCLLTPDEWYNGPLNETISDYFRAHRNPDPGVPNERCRMCRIILARQDDLELDGSLRKWAEEHIQKDMYIGFRDTSALIAEGANKEIRDFAVFMDRYGGWVVEAVGLKSDQESNRPTHVTVKVSDGRDAYAYHTVVAALGDGKWPRPLLDHLPVDNRGYVLPNGGILTEIGERLRALGGP